MSPNAPIRDLKREPVLDVGAASGEDSTVSSIGDASTSTWGSAVSCIETGGVVSAIEAVSTSLGTSGA